jgi:hypothetical protein
MDYSMKWPENLGVIFFLLFLFGCIRANAQTESENAAKDETSGKHRLTILMANAFIPAADNIAGQSNMFIVPAWGINYDYWINDRIGFGVHNTLILQQYKIEKSREDIIIERSFPVVITGEILFKPVRNLMVSAGVGRELEKHESFTVVNLGLEYGFELGKGLELSLNLLYDNKINAYDSWMFGVGFSKFFSRTKKQE